MRVAQVNETNLCSSLQQAYHYDNERELLEIASTFAALEHSDGCLLFSISQTRRS